MGNHDGEPARRTLFVVYGRRGAAGLGATVGPARVLNVLKQVAERVAKRIGEIALSN